MRGGEETQNNHSGKSLIERFEHYQAKRRKSRRETVIACVGGIWIIASLLAFLLFAFKDIMIFAAGFLMFCFGIALIKSILNTFRAGYYCDVATISELKEISREDNPSNYWFHIAMYLFLALICFIGGIGMIVLFFM